MSAEKDGFARFTKRYPRGTVLFNEGDEGEDMFIIRSGRVAIKKRVAHGEITVAVLENAVSRYALTGRVPRPLGLAPRRREPPIS